jgi:hypothetical protein
VAERTELLAATLSICSGPVTRYALPDGRTLATEPMADGMFHLWIEGEEGVAEIMGSELDVALADLLGYVVAHEEWPAWIDDLARRIEADLKAHS